MNLKSTDSRSLGGITKIHMRDVGLNSNSKFDEDFQYFIFNLSNIKIKRYQIKIVYNTI